MSTGNQQVFANSPIVTFSAENTVCPSCHGRMKVLKTRERNLALYSVGTITAHETVYSCPVCGYMAPSQELASLAPPRNTFGYDVMIYIGEAIFRHARNEREIRAHLQERGISISASEVGLLADKYICYLACAHRETTAALRTHMQGQGGYILHLDGTCEADSPHLFVGLDEISSFVLDSVKLPSEKKEAIVPFLQELELAYGKPVALVHDMGPGILSAVKEVFPEAPDFICHFHFLRDIGKDLFQREHDHLRSRLRCHGVQGKLRKVLQQCQITQEICTEELETLGATIESEQKSTDSCSEEFQLYTLIHWALAGKAEGDGYGFPFDRPYMTFLTRLYKLRDTINKMKLHQRLPLANTVLAVLRPMWYDRQLVSAYKRLKRKMTVFDQLRVAMGIAEPAGKLGLNDPGSGAIHTIEARVKKFHHQLVEDDELQEIGYQKMRQQLEKYWEKLFADPIIVTSRGEPLTLTPQRTNNILEKFFRDMKHHHCRKSGYAAMNKSLTAMLSTTPLVKNLDNPEYYKLLLNGSHSLAERFSQVDVTTIQKMFSAEKESVQRVNPRIKKLIKDPKLPNRLMAMVRSA